ncbi:MAG: transcriptional regulator [Gammaproteobacteria bacterium]|nr:transcriptional regulator [Gammaproteobacteria bacterium]
MISSLEAMDLQEAGIGAFFRPRDLAPLEISHRKLQGLVSRGVVENFGNGLYRLTEVPATELETIAMVAAAVPNVVVCLLTALQVHEIGTQSPHKTWVALDRKARKPAHPPARLRVVRFSGPMLTYGVVRRSALGVPFRITSPARTVVDCFRYRNKLGLEIALEALQDVLRSRTATVGEIMRAAEVCRARTVMRAYLEALPS